MACFWRRLIYWILALVFFVESLKKVVFPVTGPFFNITYLLSRKKACHVSLLADRDFASQPGSDWMGYE